MEDIANTIIFTAIPTFFGIVSNVVTFFDIGLNESKNQFDKIFRAIKKEKMDILERVIVTNRKNYIDQISTDAEGLGGEYIEGLLEKIEKIISLEKDLIFCMKIFNIYYYSLLVIFVGGAILFALLYFKKYNIFAYFASYGINSDNIIFWFFIYFIIIFSFFSATKKKLDDKYRKDGVI